MANRFPLIVNSSVNQIQELAASDFLDLTSSGIVNSGNITSVGNISGGNLLTGGLLSITGASTAGSYSTTGNVTGGNILTGGLTSVTGNITGGNLITGGLLSVNSGNASGAVIVNAGGNGVGNIGSATGYFNTLFATASKALYADLAEMYLADNSYQPGTVLDFGGNAEVTITTISCSSKIAGIVSTNPSYLMNSCLDGEHPTAVALTGRVPCQVLGPVDKGDVLVSSNLPGVAQRIGSNWQPGVVIGKSLEVIETAEVKVIEVAVGRL